MAHEAAPLPGNDALIRLAHSLAGAAGTFGFAEISARASVLETLLVEQADGASVRAALDAGSGDRTDAGLTGADLSGPAAPISSRRRGQDWPGVSAKSRS
ncbi:Hpt domain-containing protein [Mesorhizobium sp. B2-9-1]|uniref:Hpt domain-containing protein n=1 Tax=Mesorhizobium sp. B2-9-1 TaxID=2589898 RepID=UPI001FEF1730|nr:Hpt domain-containing protein [Mesorhizobium sp. B2-9-1]